ncbi:hypothetical protein D3C81_1649300 [compost metagenome]
MVTEGFLTIAEINLRNQARFDALPQAQRDALTQEYKIHCDWGAWLNNRLPEVP